MIKGSAKVLQKNYLLFPHRDNLLLLQVGFKSLSYEMQEQRPAYDINSLLGKVLFKLSTLFISPSKLRSGNEQSQCVPSYNNVRSS